MGTRRSQMLGCRGEPCGQERKVGVGDRYAVVQRSAFRDVPGGAAAPLHSGWLSGVGVPDMRAAVCAQVAAAVVVRGERCVTKVMKWRVRGKDGAEDLWVPALYEVHEQQVMAGLRAQLDDSSVREQAARSIDTIHELKVLFGAVIVP